MSSSSPTPSASGGAVTCHDYGADAKASYHEYVAESTAAYQKYLARLAAARAAGPSDTERAAATAKSAAAYQQRCLADKILY